MFDVFGFWGIVTFLTLPIPVLCAHLYLVRLYEILVKEGLKPAEGSFLDRNRFGLSEGYVALMVFAAMVQLFGSVFAGAMVFARDYTLVGAISKIATVLAPIGGFALGAVTLCAVVYFGERLMIKVARVTVALEKLEK